ncbi:DUF1800 family protein [Horticoccus sp. 23ND18S-11]|uniref:DUF1800 family protein n=1 Tax=Horticoccus sp. 23ND18S-11 TaxID=3391832 RepID=UPI0039C90CD9
MNFLRFAVRSFAAVLALSASLRAQEPRLANISTRAQTGPGAAVLTAGFVIGPGANKQVLIRAIGPTLGISPFNVPGSLADPVLTVFNSANVAVATNDDWGTPVGAGAATAATLSSTFGSVGAFALGATSRDSAVIVTLPAGNYTAQVAGKGTGTGASGNALLEVYEIGGANAGAKLLNTSTRLQVSSTSAPIIGFVVAPGTGTRKLLVRTAGPALNAFNLTGTLADPSIRVTTATGAIIATNDNWNTPSDTRAADTAGLTAAFSLAGAFAFPPGSNDAAVLVDLAPGNYGIQVSGSDATSGLAIIEVYDLTPVNPPTVTITATKSAADESGNNPGEFTFTRSGDTALPLVVNYGVGGSAVNGYNYPPLLGTVTIPVGATSTKITLSPNPVVQSEGTDSVVLSVATGPGYLVGAQAAATVTITHSPATLYVASVRPTAAAVSGTAASGTATLLLSSTGKLASINVSFSNLSSTQVTAHLVIGSTEDYVVNLPPGQVTGAQWFFAPTGPYSVDALLEALRTGNIAVRIDSAKYPDGELKGAFIQGAGSRTFTAPAAPPAVALGNVTATDAARFLTQATFGPTRTEIETLTGGSLDAWITAQLALPFSGHRAATVADRTAFGGSNSFTNWNAIHMPNRQSAWFKLALTAPDQLRQRVAFALSQILVVSDISLGDDNRTEPLANYYDILGNGAFGNYRTLLEQVTLSPMMGEYLSSLRNSKADPVTGQTPDENYAREVMQLFTIGLQQLNPDGTLALGADGLPIPTYDQATITEMAKVFTGWAYPSTNLNAFRTAGANYISPMQLYPAFHDDSVKNLSPVSSTPIPAAQGGVRDLQLALDALFNHPNTGPFISKLLIQRLVTSNPSPGYVYRVAQVWNQQKTSPTQLGAVVRAILTDYEARSPAVASNLSYGKLKEPLLRLTGLLRTFGASSASGRFLGLHHTVNGVVITSATPRPATAAEISTINSTTLPYSAIGNLAQAALRSPTVFNFYHSDYVLPGPLAAAGLVAPEFEITDDNFAISVPNYLRTFVNAVTPVANGAPTAAAPYVLLLNTTYEQSLVATPAALLDHLSRVLTAGTLPTAARTRITAALAALPTATSTEDRAKTAIYLVLTSPAAAIQK